MKTALCVLGASAFAGVALGQTWTPLPQSGQVRQTEQAGVYIQRRTEPVELPVAPVLTESKPPRMAMPVSKVTHDQPQTDTPLPAGTVAPQPQGEDRRAVWLRLLAEAEAQGLTPALAAGLETDAAWLESEADADFLQRLGWVFHAAGRLTEAEHWFTQALTRSVESAGARQGLAQVCVQRGELARAFELLAPMPEAAGQRRDLASTLAERARAAGDDTGERRWLLAALELAPTAQDLHERLAWNAQRRKDWVQAEALFRRLLAHEPRPAWTEGLAASLQAQGRIEAAYAALEGLDSATAWRAALAGELAEQARQTGRRSAERDWLLAAQRDAPADADLRVRLARNAETSGDRAAACAAWGEAYRLRPEADLAAAWGECLLGLGRREELLALAQSDDGALAHWWRVQQARQLQARGLARAAARQAPQGALPELAGVLAPRVGLGFAGRDKSGSEGGSRLRLRLSPSLRYAGTHAGGWLEAEVSGVGADAGVAQPGLPFGSAVAGQPASPTRLDDSAILQLRWSTLAAAGPYARLGTTPSAAALPATASFALGWREVGEDAAWRIELAREPVRDSVLSLAGQTDPASGFAWGRVLRTGLSASGYRRLDGGPWTLAGELRGAHLDGRSVADNRQLVAQVELMHGFAAEGFRFLQAGPTLGWEGYQRDLSAFTWGHGGYFSPRDYTRLGAAVQFETAARPDWLLAGRLSAEWQRVERAAAPCHPLPPPAGPTTCTVDYPGERKQGLAGQVELRGVTRLSPRWQLAGAYAWRHGQDFRDQIFGLELRYLFEPQSVLHSEDLPDLTSRLW